MMIHLSRFSPRPVRLVACVSAMFALAMTGCSHPVLGRPALLGASVTSGAGAAVSPGVPFDSIPTDRLVRGERSTGTTAPALAVDAAVAFSAVVTAPHETPLNLGDGGVFLDSDMALRDQAKAAAAWHPSVVIAVDWLFWPVHQAISLELPAEERAARRLASVDAALADLDAFSCPIVIGDVPEMRRAVGGLLRAEHDPGAAVRAQANERLAAWASARPNRFVLAVSALANAVNEGAPIEVAGFTYGPGEAMRLVQRDGLHATPEGLAVLMAAAFDRLCAEGLATTDERRHSLHEIATAMEREADSASKRARPGLLAGASLSALWDRYSKRLEARDDAGMAAALDQALDRLESFDRNPLGDNDRWVATAISLTGLDVALGETLGGAPLTAAVYERHWRRLSSDALADVPQPWRFDLWLMYAEQLPEPLQQITADSLASRRDARGPFPEPYASIIWGAARTLGDGRTLARCFPEIDEAYPFARRKALASFERFTKAGRDDPLSVTMLRFAVADLCDILASRAAAGMPDLSRSYLDRARSDGLGAVVDASDRFARIEVGVAEFKQQCRVIGSHGSITAGADVFARLNAGTDAGTGAGAGASTLVTPELGPRVLLPTFLRGFVAPSFVAPSLGFGFADDLDGAAVVISGETGVIAVTRAELDAGGKPHLLRGPKAIPATATCWQELGRIRSIFMSETQGTSACQTAAPVGVASSVNLDGFTEAVRRAATKALATGAPAGSNADLVRGVMWPASVCATGLVDRAVVRVPMGWDDAAHAPRWATFELTGQQVILLGTLETRADGDPATAPLRLHAVWESGPNAERFTAEVIELSGLRVGSAAALAKAINDEVINDEVINDEVINDEAIAGAEVRLSWRARK